MNPVFSFIISLATTFFALANSYYLYRIDRTYNRRLDYLQMRLDQIQFPPKRMHPGSLPQPRQKD